MPEAAILWGATPTMLSPSKCTPPRVGRYSPVSTLKNVVLPAPLGPIRATIEPVGMAKSTSLTATRPPNSTRTWRASRSSSVTIRTDFFERISAVCRTRCRNGFVIEAGLQPVTHLFVFEHAAVGLLHLSGSGRGNETLRAEQHHQHEHETEEPELVLLEVDLRAEATVELAAQPDQAALVKPGDDHRAGDGTPDVAHSAEDHRAEDDDRESEN